MHNISNKAPVIITKIDGLISFHNQPQEKRHYLRHMHCCSDLYGETINLDNLKIVVQTKPNKTNTFLYL